MPRKGENIRKRKDGRWEGRYIDNSTTPPTTKSVYGKQYLETKQKLLEAKALNIYQNNKENKISFKDIFKEWIIEKQSTVKKSSLIKYEGIINNHILPYWCEMNLSDLNNNDVIHDFFGNNLKNNKHLSNSMLKTILYILKSVVDYSNEKYMLTNRVEYKISFSKKSELLVFNEKETKKMITSITELKKTKDLGILLSLCCGLRIGEICALKWSDIDIENGTLYINKTVQRLKKEKVDQKKTELVISSPKSISSIRIIPLPMFLIEYLSEFKKNNVNESYVISGSINIFEPRSYQYYFKAFLQRENIRIFNYHILRHTFATRCIEKGVDIKSLSELLGHSNVNITLDKYVHPSLEQKRFQLEKLFISGQKF